jgi:hypothetical protein
MESGRIWVPPGGSADPRRDEDRAAAREPTEQELAAQLREQMRQVEISDLLVQTLTTVSSLGYQRLADETRDLEQARLAIDALDALLPVLEGAVADDVLRDFRQVVANMKFAYADAVSDESAS